MNILQLLNKPLVITNTDRLLEKFNNGFVMRLTISIDWKNINYNPIFIIIN